MVQPGPDEPVRYEAHIKPLFRPKDQHSMTFAFDLWSYDDVSSHADKILRRLRRREMPCDGPWPADQVDLFDRWVRGGKLP